MTMKSAKQRAEKIALQWSYGKNVRIKHYGPILTDLIESAILKAEQEVWKRAIEEIDSLRKAITIQTESPFNAGFILACKRSVEILTDLKKENEK